MLDFFRSTRASSLTHVLLFLWPQVLFMQLYEVACALVELPKNLGILCEFLPEPRCEVKACGTTDASQMETKMSGTF